MNKNTADVLAKWKSLETGNGLKKASGIARALTVVGAILCVVVVLCIYFMKSSIVGVIIALVAGWVIAERNALNSRLEHWPILKRYIDWKKVEVDLLHAQHVGAAEATAGENSPLPPR